MRIAYSVVKNIGRGGGIEKYTRELGRRLAAKGHDITVFTMGHYGEVEKEVEGMKIASVPSLAGPSTEKFSTSMFAAIEAFLNRKDFDIVHCHSVAAGTFGFLYRLRGIKTVLQMHGIEWQRSRWNSIGKNMLRMMEGISLHSHNAFTAVSKSQCDFYQDRHGIRMRYIPTGADIKEILQAKEILDMGLEPGKYILFASRLVREKGAHYLIESFRDLSTDYHLVIAGNAAGEDVYKNELSSLANGDRRILFPGYVEGNKLEELFGNAALYVLPSEIEGLSISLLEAMSYGNCCLVSDIPENCEAVGDTGITFKNRNVADLREKLADLLSNETLRQRYGKEARERVRNHYSWDRIAEEFEDLYQSIAA